MIETKRKRLLYQAQHRGMNENDILLGGFARENIHKLSPEELEDFALLMEALDADLLYWLTDKEPVPARFATPLWDKIIAYVRGRF